MVINTSSSPRESTSTGTGTGTGACNSIYSDTGGVTGTSQVKF